MSQRSFEIKFYFENVGNLCHFINARNAFNNVNIFEIDL